MLTFDWEGQPWHFEGQAAPYIQYVFVRQCILKKAGQIIPEGRM